MTVSELIKLLQEHDPSAPVFTRTNYDEYEVFEITGAHQSQLSSLCDGASNGPEMMEEYEDSDPHQFVVTLEL